MKNKKLKELSKKELIALRYFLTRDAYNQYGYRNQYDKYYRLCSDYSQENDIKGCLDFSIKNFSKDELDTIYSIVTNQCNVHKLTSGGVEKMKQNLALIEKMLFIFSGAKEPEILNASKRLLEIKKTLEERVNLPSLEYIFNNLSNPLENKELLRKVNAQMLKKSGKDKNGKISLRKPYVRQIWISGDKHAQNENLNSEKTININEEILNDYMKFYFDLCEQSNFEMKEGIVTPNNIKKLREFVKTNSKILVKKIEKFRKQGEIPKSAKNFANWINQSLSTDLTKLLEFMYLHMEFTHIEGDVEHYGKSLDEENEKALKLTGKTRGTEVRLYLNPGKNQYTYLFFNEYIKRCKMYGIDYDMKGFRVEAGSNYDKDGSVFYSTVSAFPIRVKILEEIKKEHPEWISTFGSPVSSTALFNNSYYGVSHNGIHEISKELSEYFGYSVASQTNTGTYNDFFDQLSTYAFYSTVAKYAVKYKLIDNPIIKDLAILKDVKRISKKSLNSSLEIKGKNFYSIAKLLEENGIIEKLKRKGISLEDDKWIMSLQKRMQALSNIYQGRNINDTINICISDIMYAQLQREQNPKRPTSPENEGR